MPKVYEIRDYFEKKVPNFIKMENDNPGLLIGMTNTEVKKVLVALDITEVVIQEAVQSDAQLVISHHPIFFDLKNISDDSRIGRKIIRLIYNGISTLCLHTNLDAVRGGVNDALIRKLGVEPQGILGPVGTLPNGEEYGNGRIGVLAGKTDMGSFLALVKNALGARGLRYHDSGRPVERIGVCGGTGGGYLEDAIRHGCDTFVTSDIKHSQFIAAREWGINLIDAGHHCTENTVVPALARMLKEAFPELEVRISQRSEQPLHFYM